MTESNSNQLISNGYISAINGSLIEVKGIENKIKLHDLVKVSKFNILGEVIQILSDHVVVQCYEDTYDLKLKEAVINLKQPLSMELAPGLLSNIFDGIQRPLDTAFKESNETGFLERGIELSPLSRTKKWHFIPLKKVNHNVENGEIIGSTKETNSLEHKIMVPPGISGKLTYIVEEGDYTIEDEIYRIEVSGKEKSFTMLQKWPITKIDPIRKRQPPMNR